MNVHLYILYILLSVIVLHVHYLYPTTMNSYTAVFIQRIGSNLSYLQFNIFLKKSLVLNISVFSPFTHLSSKQNGDIPGDNVSCLIYNEWICRGVIYFWGLPARPFGNAQGWEGAYWVSTAVGYPWHQHWISTFQPVLCSGPFKSSSQSSLRPPPNPHFANTVYLLLDFSLPPFIFLFNGILFSFADRWLSFCWCLRESPWSMAESHHQTKPNRTLYN